MSKHLFIKLSFLIFLTLLIHQTSQAHVGSTCSTHAECNANPSNICVQEICQKALTLPGEPTPPSLCASFKPDPNQWNNPQCACNACGNGVCEPGNGENLTSCPGDCTSSTNALVEVDDTPSAPSSTCTDTTSCGKYDLCCPNSFCSGTIDPDCACTDGFCGDGEISNGEECEQTSDCPLSDDLCVGCNCMPLCRQNGTLDSFEYCDPTASPTGCGENSTCSDECRCSVDCDQLCPDPGICMTVICRNNQCFNIPTHDPLCIETSNSCGDGIVQTGEVCDHGANNGTTDDTCGFNCQPVTGTTPDGTLIPLCGNGTLEASEECDSGLLNGTDTCDNDCTLVTATAPTTLCFLEGSGGCGNQTAANFCSSLMGSAPLPQSIGAWYSSIGMILTPLFLFLGLKKRR